MLANRNKMQFWAVEFGVFSLATFTGKNLELVNNIFILIPEITV
jgi:hypothetical protein